MRQAALAASDRLEGASEYAARRTHCVASALVTVQYLKVDLRIRTRTRVRAAADGRAVRQGLYVYVYVCLNGRTHVHAAHAYYADREYVTRTRRSRARVICMIIITRSRVFPLAHLT